MHILHNHNYAQIGHMTVFARILRYGTKTQLLRKDSDGEWSYIGGKAEEGETDLFGQVLEGELGEEANGTLNPAFFGSPEFKVNCLLAHHTPLVFCNDMSGKRYIRDPVKYAQPVKVRVIFVMYEVSGNSVPPGKRNLGFREYSRIESQPVRENVRHTERMAKNWKWGVLEEPRIDYPLRPNLGKMRSDFENIIKMHPDDVERYAPLRARSFHIAPRPAPVKQSAAV